MSQVRYWLLPPNVGGSFLSFSPSRIIYSLLFCILHLNSNMVIQSLLLSQKQLSPPHASQHLSKQPSSCSQQGKSTDLQIEGAKHSARSRTDDCANPCGRQWPFFCVYRQWGHGLTKQDWDILTKNGWVTDNVINEAQSLLKIQYPHLNGLQSVMLGITLSYTKEFIQVLHTGRGHWVTLSTIGCREDENKCVRQLPTCPYIHHIWWIR